MVWSWFSNKSTRLYSCCRSWAPHRRTLLQTAWTWPPHCHPWPCSSMPQYVHIYLYYLYCLCIIYIYIFFMCVLIWLFCTVYVSHQKMEKKHWSLGSYVSIYFVIDMWYLLFISSSTRPRRKESCDQMVGGNGWPRESSALHQRMNGWKSTWIKWMDEWIDRSRSLFPTAFPERAA